MSRMRQIPSLGPRGEGWVALQMILFAVIGVAGLVSTNAGPAPAAGLGFVLLILGTLLGLGGLFGLQSGKALTAVPHPRDGARLVETGAYRLVRHPVYGGIILGALGWSFVRASGSALVASLILAVVLDLKRRREEVWLTARYPGYEEYAARTRRLIPWIW